MSTLIFDLDGTISDPSLGVGRCLNHALEAHGFERMGDDRVAEVIGPPLDEAFGNLCPDADTSVISRLVRTYRERYEDVGFSENTLYPGVRDALEILSNAGLPLGVCTSKRGDFAEQVLCLFGISAYFRFVDGGDIGVKKRRQLAGLLRTGKIDARTIMIGDRAVDITAARANGLRSIGVLWGFGSESELREAGARVTLRRPRELQRLGL